VLTLRLCLFPYRMSCRVSCVVLCQGSWLLMFVALCLNMEILSFSPQYATFGSQYYMQLQNTTNAAGGWELVPVRADCTLSFLNDNANSNGGGGGGNLTLPIPSAPALLPIGSGPAQNGTGAGYNYCVMSQVATFIQIINIQLPFFGTADQSSTHARALVQSVSERSTLSLCAAVPRVWVCRRHPVLW
jgi:hypothetical protein